MTRKQHFERIAIVKKIAQVTFHDSFIRTCNENLEDTYSGFMSAILYKVEISSKFVDAEASGGRHRKVTVVIFNRLQLVTTLTDFDITDTSYLTKLLKSNVVYNMNHSGIRNSTMPSYT